MGVIQSFRRMRAEKRELSESIPPDVPETIDVSNKNDDVEKGSKADVESPMLSKSKHSSTSAPNADAQLRQISSSSGTRNAAHNDGMSISILSDDSLLTKRKQKKSISPNVDEYYNMSSENRSRKEVRNELIRVGLGKEGTLDEQAVVDEAGPLNYLNFFIFVTNGVVSFAEGIFGFFADQTVLEVSGGYANLLAAPYWLYYIWIVVFFFQGIFAVAQFHPALRNHPLLTDGISFYFFLSMSSQTIWVFVFVRQALITSIIIISAVWIFLLILITNQYKITMRHIRLKRKNQNEDAGENQEPRTNILHFLFLRFPFDLHFGWITVGTVLNVNLALAPLGAEPAAEIACAFLSLVFLQLVASISLFLKRANLVVALVIAIAAASFAQNLSFQNEYLIDRFGEHVVKAAEYTAAGVLILTQFSIVIRAFVFPVLKFFIGGDKQYDTTNDEQATKSSYQRF